MAGVLGHSLTPGPDSGILVCWWFFCCFIRFVFRSAGRIGLFGFAVIRAGPAMAKKSAGWTASEAVVQVGGPGADLLLRPGPLGRYLFLKPGFQLLLLWRPICSPSVR